jgi:hypothetical protein
LTDAARGAILAPREGRGTARRLRRLYHDPTRPARSEGYIGDLMGLVAETGIPDAES